MVDVRMTMDEYDALRRLILSERESEGAKEADGIESKPKRKPSRYNRVYAKQYKIYRAKHPRSTHLTATKAAHRATRKALGTNKKR